MVSGEYLNFFPRTLYFHVRSRFRTGADRPAGALLKRTLRMDIPSFPFSDMHFRSSIDGVLVNERR